MSMTFLVENSTGSIINGLPNQSGNPIQFKHQVLDEPKCPLVKQLVAGPGKG